MQKILIQIICCYRFFNPKTPTKKKIRRKDVYFLFSGEKASDNSSSEIRNQIIIVVTKKPKTLLSQNLNTLSFF